MAALVNLILLKSLAQSDCYCSITFAVSSSLELRTTHSPLPSCSFSRPSSSAWL